MTSYHEQSDPNLPDRAGAARTFSHVHRTWERTCFWIAHDCQTPATGHPGALAYAGLNEQRGHKRSDHHATDERLRAGTD